MEASIPPEVVLEAWDSDIMEARNLVVVNLERIAALMSVAVKQQTVGSD